jgi:phage terminase large subunit GpA-like protein
MSYPTKKDYYLYKGDLVTEPGFLEGSREEWYVPCPHCNPEANENAFMFVIEWENIKWSKEINPETGDPKEVWCECPGCGGKIIESKHKTWMLDHGDWFSTKNNLDYFLDEDYSYSLKEFEKRPMFKKQQ